MMSSRITRLFRHPAIIASVVLLLVNDHLLKAYAPSWLTGKISDFAGLFFFPFLVALCLRPFFRQDHAAVFAGFSLTATLFTALKTLPAANSALTVIVSNLLGFTPQILLDPSDLFALLALWPAWALWSRTSRTPIAHVRPRKHNLALLALASFAALASTPACTPPDVNLRLMVLEGKLYAGIQSETVGSEIYTYSSTWEPHWYLWRAPNKVLNDMLLIDPPALPYFACDPDNKLTCYRVDGRPQIEESRDGGQTWQVVWQIPPGRLEVLRRLPHSRCKISPNPGIDHIVAFPADSGMIVVAVTGNEGTVIKEGNGPWQRVPLGGYGPNSYTPDSFLSALLLLPWETTTAGFVSLAGYFVLGFWIVKASKGGLPGQRHLPHWFVRLGLIFIIVIPSMIMTWTVNQDDYYLEALLSFTSLPALIFVIFIFILTLSNMKDEDSNACLTVFAAVSALFFLPISFFLLWLYAVIPVYLMALLLSIVFPLLIYAACFRRLIRSDHPRNDRSDA